MISFRSYITETADTEVCRMFSSKSNPVLSVERGRSNWAHLPQGWILHAFNRWSDEGRSEKNASELAPRQHPVIDAVFDCPNRADWSKCERGAAIYRGLWRTYDQLAAMKPKFTVLTNLLPTGRQGQGDWIHGTGTYASRLPLHSWTREFVLARPFAGGAHIMRPDVINTVRMVMQHRVTDPNATIELDKVSAFLENTGEKEVIFNSSGMRSMQVEFVINMRDILYAAHYRRSKGMKDIREILATLVGKENADVLMQKQAFVTMLDSEKLL